MFLFHSWGTVAIITKIWLPIFIAIGLAWVVYGFSEYKRRHKKPILLPEDYDKIEVVDQFIDWWLTNDPQLWEIGCPVPDEGGQLVQNYHISDSQFLKGLNPCTARHQLHQKADQTIFR